jgi:hypothetical protein
MKLVVIKIKPYVMAMAQNAIFNMSVMSVESITMEAKANIVIINLIHAGGNKMA